MSKLRHYVIAADKFAEALLGQASLDGLLAGDGPKEVEAAFRRSRKRREALALLVLADRIVIPLIGGDASPLSAYSVPILEEGGVLEWIPVEAPIDRDTRTSRGDAAWKKVVARMREYKPFIVSRLMSEEILRDISKRSADVEGRNRGAVFANMLDCLFAHYLGDDEARDRVERTIEWVFFDLMSPTAFRTTPEGRTRFDELVYILSSAFADELDVYANLSSRLSAGVATHLYTQTAGRSMAGAEADIVPSNLLRSYCVVQLAVREEGIPMPEIRDLRHALELRQDPNVVAFRRQLALFAKTLPSGDEQAVREVRMEASRAAAVLSRLAAGERALDWFGYACIPGSVAAGLLRVPPIVGAALAVLPIAGKALIRAAKRKLKWLLFGN